jgi:hypothetical protein
MKTAVEWLESQLTEYLQKMYKFEINQAKEMEKKQLNESWKDGFTITSQFDNFEHYYKETFKKENNEN